VKGLLLLPLALLIALLPASMGGAHAIGKVSSRIIPQDAAKGVMKAAKLRTARNGHTVTRTMPFLSDSTLEAAEEALGVSAADERAEAADASADVDPDFSDIGGGKETLGCAKRDGKDGVRVNQDCSFRRQAETDITYNPADPDNLVAGQNDSRVGFNQCGIDFSTDGGNHWGDLLPPFRQKVNNPAAEEPTASDPNRHTILGGDGTLHTYDAGSDPALAVDSQGRSFFSCVAFDVFSNASMVYVTQSPLGAKGSFYFNIGQFGRAFVAAEDNNIEVFHDKNMISADRYASSPNHDNVYLTWTVFRFSPLCGPQPNPDQDERYCSSPIFGSMSTDHGIHWSTPEEISGAADALCFFGNFFDPTRNPHACAFDQGSYSVALPNGDLEVIFNNGNTAAGNPNGQQLGVHCRPSGDSAAGTAHLNCIAPAKVGDDVIEGEPQCDFGRGPEECIPGAYIRTNDFPRITKDNTQNNHLYAVWQDYRNDEYDIQMSMSTDGGLTWTEVGTVNPDTGLDHYMPATDQATKGDRNGVSYYRTDRIPDENTTPEGGFAPGQPGVDDSDSDYVLAGGTGGSTPYDFKVVSPVFPPPDGAQTGFNGDYSGLTVNRGEDAHPIWSDTRNADPYSPANGVGRDEDVFTAKVGLPNGKGKPGPGKIGK
jgi:hypothetical protein